MHDFPSKQEAINVVLAQLLTERGMTASPEAMMRGAAVDVLVSFHGLRLAIEGEVDDQSGAADRAWRKAQERVERSLAQVGLAVVYPKALRGLATGALPHGLAEANLKFSLCRRPATTTPNWQTGKVSFLRAVLEESFSHLLSEKEIKDAVKLLKDCIDDLARDAFPSAVAVRRACVPLGIPPADGKQQAHVARIAALVITNALLFQEELAKVKDGVSPLRQCFESGSPQESLLESWRYILREINYHAVFNTASQILAQLPADRKLDEALQRSYHRVSEVVRMQVTLEHDLTGRLYHLLLGAIAKHLGAFYTSVSAAVLLLRVGLDPKRWDIRWDDANDVSALLIGDLACGTGTLLAAALQVVVDNFLKESARTRPIDDLPAKRNNLISKLIEQGIWGLDVLASATHLTATTLALPVPEAMAKGMHLYALDMGIDKGKVRLGSLDLLSDTGLTPSLSMFPRTGQAYGRKATAGFAPPSRIQIPNNFHLLCMNPPFTRTCGDNLLFGSTPAKTRRQLQTRLAQLTKSSKIKASITAGLGSVFLAIADRQLRTGGRLAFVLPKTLVSGIEWSPSRKILKDYALEVLIASHDPNRWNFSENSDLSEVLFLAKKGTGTGKTLCVNLWKNSDSPLAAMEVAEQLRDEHVPDLHEGTLAVHSEGERVGEAFTVSWEKIKYTENWMPPLAFAQADLVRMASDLEDGFARIGGQKYSVPLCYLVFLGTLGPDRRRLWATFAAMNKEPGHPAFWGHDAGEVTTLMQSPNAYLAKLSRPKETQKKGYADTLVRQSGNLLIAERMWLNTQRAPAVLTTEPVLSNVWWPIRLKDEHNGDAAKALVLWMNSTLGLLNLLAVRAETRGAWVDFKKPTVQQLRVLNVEDLGLNKLQELGRVFDSVSIDTLQPLREMDTDDTRRKIDDAICGVLGLPDLAGVRHQLSLEPIISLKPLTSKFLAH